MPGPEFFRNLGLFVLDGFLHHGLCTRLCTEMSMAPSKPGAIFLGSGEGRVDESIRRVLRAKVRGTNERQVEERLELLRPRLEEYFRISLPASEPPEFLVYMPGGFFSPHADATPHSPPATRRRRVSVVIFLNSESDLPAQGSYGGGQLRFHRILNDPQWHNCAFSLDSQPGRLVAFRSDALHEVQPVTFGHRFTVVSWFLAGVLEPGPGITVPV